MTARTGRDPGERYRELAATLGNPVSKRVDARATREQKRKLSKLSPTALKLTRACRRPDRQRHRPRARQTMQPSAASSVSTANGWFAARPSGTEDVYKIYGESFRGEEHLKQVLAEAQQVVDAAIA